MKPITLYWCDKFRQLCADKSLSHADIIHLFHLFCELEEEKVSDRWEDKEKEASNETVQRS